MEAPTDARVSLVLDTVALSFGTIDGPPIAERARPRIVRKQRFGADDLRVLSDDAITAEARRCLLSSPT